MTEGDSADWHQGVLQYKEVYSVPLFQFYEWVSVNTWVSVPMNGFCWCGNMAALVEEKSTLSLLLKVTVRNFELVMKHNVILMSPSWEPTPCCWAMMERRGGSGGTRTCCKIITFNLNFKGTLVPGNTTALHHRDRQNQPIMKVYCSSFK